MQNYLEHYRDKTVLVTGGAGAIGSNLSRRLAELGAQVIILDDLSSGERWNVPSLPGILFVEGDILDEVKLKRVFFERPQIVFHLAAFFANQNSVDHPERDLMVNGMGTLRLLEYSVFTGVERFIYASSGCSIYGSESPLPPMSRGARGQGSGGAREISPLRPSTRAPLHIRPRRGARPVSQCDPQFHLLGDEGPAAAHHRHGGGDARLHLRERHRGRAAAGWGLRERGGAGV